MNNVECAKLLKDIVGDENVKINESMAKHTSYKVGGKADVFVKADSFKKLIQILKLDINLPITIIGNGSNLLVKDNGIRGLVLNYTANKYEIKNSNQQIEVEVEAGIVNAYLAQILLKKEITGFEFASGIPGTIGGAIFMNAGAYGREMADIVKNVTYIDINNNEVTTIENEKCNFGYRNSIFMKKKAIILKATMLFTKGIKNDIKKAMDEYKDKRVSTQPLEYPNGGSTFKRGDGFITAKLIDEAGLKGYKIGGAEVSTKHAGFIINSNNATAEDILKLAEYVQKKVYEKFNKKIELEVRVLGE